jgi:glucose dehydrogenase
MPATKDRGYNAILLGVGLMILAIGGSTCAGALTGDGQFLVAGVALVVGVVLVFVGTLQNARR